MVQSARSRNVLTLYTLADDIQCHRARLVLAAKGVSYERVIVDRGIPPMYLDRQMWEKIVFNLMSNAFKYTLKGSI